MIFLQSSLLFLGITAVVSYSDFKLEIPNGDNVPNPCVANTKWKAPGHTNLLGGGKRNPFGEDFDKAGRTWTRSLCQEDSDGDGKSNGEELGDPNCVWTKASGVPPEVTLFNSLSHPGICEPKDSAKCQGKNPEGLCAQSAKYECDFNVAGADNDVSTINITLDETTVPAKETTYICQSFNLDDYLPDPTKPYHVVGSEPLLVNENVMHHIIVYGCLENDANVQRLKKPGICGMAAAGACSGTVGAWTVGLTGECSHGDFGYKIGAGSYKYIILEMHWNNPLLRQGTKDSSGVKLHITPNLRSNNLATLTVGQMNLRLEPGKERILETGTCSSSCTEKILKNKDIHIIAANNHMHYLGKEGHIEVLRNGKVVHNLAEDNPFEYDTPVVHIHDPPITIKPGDEIRMKCVFKTTSQRNAVFYGDGTQAEMCFGFITYYPAFLTAEESFCTDWDGVDSCRVNEKMEEDGCNMEDFLQKSLVWTKFTEMAEACNLEQCTDKCLEVLEGWYPHEPCLRDSSFRTVLSHSVPEDYANRMRVCDKEYKDRNTSGTRKLIYNVIPILLSLLSILLLQM